MDALNGWMIAAPLTVIGAAAIVICCVIPVYIYCIRRPVGPQV